MARGSGVSAASRAVRGAINPAARSVRAGFIMALGKRADGVLSVRSAAGKYREIACPQIAYPRSFAAVSSVVKRRVTGRAVVAYLVERFKRSGIGEKECLESVFPGLNTMLARR